MSAAPRPAVIRKYANRRLYDTASGRFVTFADLHEMVRRGEDFVVREAKTGRDITAWVLAQIVAEEAGKGNHLLSLGYLRRLLRFYHEGLGDQLSAYLESSMDAFAANQRDLLRGLSNPFDPAGALAAFRALGERNAEHLGRLFQPAAGGNRDPAAGPGAARDEGAAGGEGDTGSERAAGSGDAVGRGDGGGSAAGSGSTAPRAAPPGTAPPRPSATERETGPAAPSGEEIEALRAQLLDLHRRLDTIERRQDE